MASTFSNLGFELQTTGENAKYMGRQDKRQFRTD